MFLMTYDQKTGLRHHPKNLLVKTHRSFFQYGTDSNVYITLFGESSDSGTSNSSGPRLLKESPAGADFNKDKFEKGKTDRFLLPCFDLGIITKIVVEKDEKVDHFTYRAYLIIAVL